MLSFRGQGALATPTLVSLRGLILIFRLAPLSLFLYGRSPRGERWLDQSRSTGLKTGIIRISHIQIN